MNGKFETACVFIFLAGVLDGLDGRVARLTHTQSDFGAQLDSLSVMVSFGAAPALIMYEWALRLTLRGSAASTFIIEAVWDSPLRPPYNTEDALRQTVAHARSRGM